MTTTVDDIVPSIFPNWMSQNFIIEPNQSPEYGFQDRSITGIGFWMMQGAGFAYSYYQRGCKAKSVWEKIADITTALAIAIITSPITIIGTIIKIVGSRFPKKVGSLTSDMIPLTSPKKIDQIYDLLQIIDAVLRENHIEYSMDGGTMLGAARSGGIIPWDDDGDLIVHHRDKQAVLALKNSFQRYGIIVEDSGLESLKFNFNEHTLRQCYKATQQDAVNIDVFFVEEDPTDGKIKPKSDFFKHQFPKEYFLSEEWENLRDYSFGPPEKGLRLRGPADPNRYLITYYGPDCFKYAIRSHNHIQLGPFSFPLVNFSMTKYAIVPGYAKGINWK